MRRSPLRRILAGSAAVLAGTAASIALAAPAQAVDVPVPFLSAHAAECLVNGEHLVRFTFHNTQSYDVTLISFLSSPAGSFVVESPPIVVAAGTESDLHQIVPAGNTGSDLALTWISAPEIAKGDAVHEDADWGDDECVAEANATFAPNCDGTTNVTLINLIDENLTFAINDEANVFDVPPGNQVVPNVASIGGLVQVAVLPKGAGPDDENVVKFLPPFTWKAPAECTRTPSPSPSPSTLSNTGTSVTGLVGTGALLVLIGAGLLVALVVMRRRRA